MTTPPNIHELAQREIDAAAHHLRMAVSILGQPLTMTAHFDDEPRPEIRREPSHLPSRHPDAELPMPPKSSCHYPSKALYEVERREILAQRWSEQNGYNFHRAGGITRRFIHHAECASLNQPPTPRGDCDCGWLPVMRFDGGEHVLLPNGHLEPYHESEFEVAKFLADPRAYQNARLDQSGDWSAWWESITADELEFTTAGEGENARFIEPPMPSDILTRHAPDLP